MNDPGQILNLGQILVERDGHVARVTINRPERRNAISFAAWQSLATACDSLAADPGVRVVVLTGAGDRAFCAGNDISEFAEKRSTAEQIEAYDAVVSHAYDVIRSIEKPLIARVRGVAVGGGFELVQLCDLQIAGAGARFAMTPALPGPRIQAGRRTAPGGPHRAAGGARDAAHGSVVRRDRGAADGVRDPRGS